MPPTRKQQVVDLLKSLETKDPVTLAYLAPNKYIQHNLQVGPGPAGVAALIQSLPPDATVGRQRYEIVARFAAPGARGAA